MSNTTATPVEPSQTEVDVQQLIEIIENNLGKDSQPLPNAGRIRIRAALETVLSRRDSDTARLNAALNHARTGLSEAESALNDDWGSRGGGSDLASWDCDEAAEKVAAASARMNAALRGEVEPKSVTVQIREALQSLNVKYSDCGDGTYLVEGYGRCTLMLMADLVLEGGITAADGRTETVVRKDSPLAAFTHPAFASPATD